MLPQNEYQFILPKGYVDEHGNLHRDGVMRLATAADEILPMKDPRVAQNPAYLEVILLSRVVVRLGTLPMVTTQVIENLFSADHAYLLALYNRINQVDSTEMLVTCPYCHHKFNYNYAAVHHLPGPMKDTPESKDDRPLVKGSPLDIGGSNGHDQETRGGKK